jgi:soluble lytic murein transglycosylase-like protein
LILGFAKTALVCGTAIFMASPAYADVLELDGGEARWIAGGPAFSAATANMQSAAFDLALPIPADLLFPEESVADPQIHASALPETYRAKVLELSARFDLSPTLIEALVWQESRWRQGAVSPKGAQGLAQLMPGTARELGVDPSDPFANLEGGARYLRQQIDRFDGDLEKALAAYNAGPGRVEKAGGIPRIRETQEYVAAIMGRLSNHSRR